MPVSIGAWIHTPCAAGASSRGVDHAFITALPEAEGRRRDGRGEVAIALRLGNVGWGRRGGLASTAGESCVISGYLYLYSATIFSEMCAAHLVRHACHLISIVTIEHMKPAPQTPLRRGRACGCVAHLLGRRLHGRCIQGIHAVRLPSPLTCSSTLP